MFSSLDIGTESKAFAPECCQWVVAVLGWDIGEMNYSFAAKDLIHRATWDRRVTSMLFIPLDQRQRDISIGNHLRSPSSIETFQQTLPRIYCRVLQNGIKYRPQSTGRTADDLSTSAVAVCCCRDSRSSLSSRVFWMAMTACAAKFFNSSICLSVNGCTSCRKITIAPTSASSLSSGMAIMVRARASSIVPV